MFQTHCEVYYLVLIGYTQGVLHVGVCIMSEVPNEVKEIIMNINSSSGISHTTDVVAATRCGEHSASEWRRVLMKNVHTGSKAMEKFLNDHDKSEYHHAAKYVICLMEHGGARIRTSNRPDGNGVDINLYNFDMVHAMFNVNSPGPTKSIAPGEEILCNTGVSIIHFPFNKHICLYDTDDLLSKKIVISSAQLEEGNVLNITLRNLGTQIVSIPPHQPIALYRVTDSPHGSLYRDPNKNNIQQCTIIVKGIKNTEMRNKIYENLRYSLITRSDELHNAKDMKLCHMMRRQPDPSRTLSCDQFTGEYPVKFI